MAHDGDATGTNAEGTDPYNEQSASTSSDPAGQVVELTKQVDEITEQLLRKSADFDNYRKRMMREKQEFASYANRELLVDIVPIIDDFERAIRSAEESKDFDAFYNGVVMIERQFASMLDRKWSLKRFESVGEEFDPQRHEAVLTEESADHDASVVLEDFQKGYLLHEKVLRPAKVKVSIPVRPPEADEQQAGAAPDEAQE